MPGYCHPVHARFSSGWPGKWSKSAEMAVTWRMHVLAWDGRESGHLRVKLQRRRLVTVHTSDKIYY